MVVVGGVVAVVVLVRVVFLNAVKVVVLGVVVEVFVIFVVDMFLMAVLLLSLLMFAVVGIVCCCSYWLRWRFVVVVVLVGVVFDVTVGVDVLLLNLAMKSCVCCWVCFLSLLWQMWML